MQTCQAYQSCPVCLHSWSKPLSRGVVCDGHRAFLPAGDAGRQERVVYKGNTYEYKDVCETPKPKYRDDAFVQSVLTICSEKKPVLGHKTAPLPCRFPGFSWLRFLGNQEIMHGSCILFMCPVRASTHVCDL